MNRFDHRITGAVAGATYAAVLHLPPAPTVACMWLGATSAAGKTSPDIDQYPQWHGRNKDIPQWWWVPRLNQFLLWVGPNNHGDPIDHRRITHWPGIPALVTVPIAVAAASLPPRLPIPVGGLSGLLTWLAWWALVAAGALVVGWTSHLVGDFPFGKRNRYRGAGIPLIFWWGHKGLNWKSNGWPAHLTVWLILIPGGSATFMRFDVVEATARTCFGG